MYVYICKVVYVGIDPAIKPGEWVPATRLRPQMAAPNFKNAAWRGWEVSDGATGEYIKDKFAPLPAQQVVSNEVVECLLPFSGRKEDGPVHMRKAEPPPPRLLDVAAAVTAPSAALLSTPCYIPLQIPLHMHGYAYTAKTHPCSRDASV